MSPCTKRLQRSTRSLASFSGTLVHCALAGVLKSMGAAATAPVATLVDWMNWRRVVSVIKPPVAMGLGVRVKT